VDRLCYRISPQQKNWIVVTTAPWPDALAQEFSSREEAVEIATIAARLAWEQAGQPTCVCIRDFSSENQRLACQFG
jgi:hypothetical protein